MKILNNDVASAPSVGAAKTRRMLRKVRKNVGTVEIQWSWSIEKAKREARRCVRDPESENLMHVGRDERTS